MYEIGSKNTEKLTYSDYAAIEDDTRYELINGELIMSPAPSTFHQRANIKLAILLENFAEKHALGIILEAPTDVILDEHNTVQPDILFISKEEFSKIQENAIYGAPDLVVEIISQSTIFADRYTKKELYERTGVKEYWLVDITNKSIEVFENIDGKFTLFSYGTEKGTVKSKFLAGFEVDIENIIQEIKI
jgi:Uma2 family endonuclease